MWSTLGVVAVRVSTLTSKAGIGEDVVDHCFQVCLVVDWLMRMDACLEEALERS